MAPRRARRSSGGGFRGIARRQAAQGEQLLKGAKPLEMLLFGAGGYYLGDALEQTGLPLTLQQRSAFVNQWFNNAWQVAKLTGGAVLNKTAGVATFMATLADAAKHGLKPRNLNSALPFSIGAMLDPPSDTSSTSGGGRW